MSLRGKLETFADTAKKWAGVAWRRGGRVAWVVAATSIVMFLPLVMEIEREGSVIETDKLRIKDFRAQGYTDNQISQMGLSASVEPAVGFGAPASSRSTCSSGMSSPPTFLLASRRWRGGGGRRGGSLSRGGRAPRRAAPAANGDSPAPDSSRRVPQGLAMHAVAVSTDARE